MPNPSQPGLPITANIFFVSELGCVKFLNEAPRQISGRWLAGDTEDMGSRERSRKKNKLCAKNMKDQHESWTAVCEKSLEAHWNICARIYLTRPPHLEAVARLQAPQLEAMAGLQVPSRSPRQARRTRCPLAPLLRESSKANGSKSRRCIAWAKRSIEA